MIRSDILRAPGSGIVHGFITREGGVSEGLYASLNCGLGSDDDKAAVRENRARAVARAGAEGAPLVTCHQVHSARAVTVTEPWEAAAAPQADALVTKERGLALGILTADCAPVLFLDAEAGVIGAAHAGWKGAVTGVLTATLEAMEALGARRPHIRAAVGPCIHAASYEVGPEFRDRFLGEDRAFHAYFTAGPGDRWQFDLPGFVAGRLTALGLETVGESPADTRTDEQRFFSYRRCCLAGEGDYGRQISIIALEP
ncbi:MAG: peptidoglycan editing factor PgeF [Rhodospirillales bacterium]